MDHCGSSYPVCFFYFGTKYTLTEKKNSASLISHENHGQGVEFTYNIPNRYQTVGNHKNVISVVSRLLCANWSVLTHLPLLLYNTIVSKSCAEQPRLSDKDILLYTNNIINSRGQSCSLDKRLLMCTTNGNNSRAGQPRSSEWSLHCGKPSHRDDSGMQPPFWQVHSPTAHPIGEDSTTQHQ